MADIKISRKHCIEESDLRDQLEKLADDMARKFGIRSDFKDNKVKNKWFNLIIKEVENHSKESNFLLNILKYFERLHWIDIESEEELSFVISLSKHKNSEDREFLLNFLSQHSTISNIDEKFYLE